MAMENYELTRWCFLRGLACIYMLGFINIINQFVALLGRGGLLPVSLFLSRTSPRRHPTLFFLSCSDRALKCAGWVGGFLAALALAGLSDAFGWPLFLAVWGGLWLLYLSFVNVGQTFYSFGWESLLLETGFLALFLGPVDVGCPLAVIWLLRWLLFRVMFGAGLIKLRGDPCWRDLTCLYYYYETQPMPNPLSWYFHNLPKMIHRIGVQFNHLVELVVPFLYLLPPPFSYFGGALTAIFQGVLILSGNLSWLNYLTLILCIPCFDDSFWTALMAIPSPPHRTLELPHTVTIAALVAFIAFRSYYPIKNMLSRYQAMNSCYDPFHLVNSYGAFGGITRQRFEIILEGTYARNPHSKDAEWRPYLFKGKPVRVDRCPPVVAPYHLRLDWLMWFAAMGDHASYPWIVHLVAKLLAGDKATLKLLKGDPFGGGPPPHFIRAQLYEYSFAPKGTRGAWWQRSYCGAYLPPMDVADPQLKAFLRRHQWV